MKIVEPLCGKNWGVEFWGDDNFNRRVHQQLTILFNEITKIDLPKNLKIIKDAHPFWQCGSHDPRGYQFIEFWTDKHDCIINAIIEIEELLKNALPD